MESCHSSPHGRCYMVGNILEFTSYKLRFKTVCLSRWPLWARQNNVKICKSILCHVKFANEEMTANLSRQHTLFVSSKLTQKGGGWYVLI